MWKIGAERHFVDTLADMRGRIKSGSRYDAVKASELLFQILLDGLKDQANTEHRIDFVFRVAQDDHPPWSTEDDPLLPEMAYRSIDPRGDEERSTKEVDVENFLKVDCLYLHGEKYSVHDIIKTCRHAIGGGHFGEPRTEVQEKLIALEQEISAGGMGLPLYIIFDICGVAIRGLWPLEKTIRESCGWTGSSDE